MEKNGQTEKDNRIINYMRVSLTDRCNLRCVYCMPEGGVHFIAHNDVLRYEEILHIINLAVQKGIHKVRLTGGEPLVRKGFLGFLGQLARIDGLNEITLTTNGVLLKDLAAEMRGLGIKRINVSLDSLKKERFARITGRDLFDRVWEGILEAERVGFDPVKINVVAMKGVNDDEIQDFARLTMDRPYHVRFIEHMPIGQDNGWKADNFISILEIHNLINRLSPLSPVHGRTILDGPAQRFRMEGARGEIGLIGALSNHFCSVCNRLRLTADGHIRNCLFSDDEIDIKSPLRNNEGDAKILSLLDTAIKNKPLSHNLNKTGIRHCMRRMSAIGG